MKVSRIILPTYDRLTYIILTEYLIPQQSIIFWPPLFETSPTTPETWTDFLLLITTKPLMAPLELICTTIITL
jgi:hypothetical protein